MMRGVLRVVGASILFWLFGMGLVVSAGTLVPDQIIAFDSNRSGDYEIYLLDLNTGITRNMTNHPAQDRNPTWSPDGRYIAFESVQRTSTNAIYLIDLKDLSREPERVTPEFVRAVQPDWSPRGNYIAFSGALNRMFNNDIFLVNLYDRQIVRVTNTPNTFDYGPRWSPSGNHIAYGTNNPAIASPSDVYVVPFVEMTTQLAQERPQFVPVKVSDNDTAADPNWTPDGLVMFRYVAAPFSLYTTDIEPNAPDEPLNSLRLVMEKPDISPDGEWIVFGSAHTDLSIYREIRVARADGSEWFPITFGSQRGNFWDNAPTWRPSSE
jgi:Tol biopolymer transport system component